MFVVSNFLAKRFFPWVRHDALKGAMWREKHEWSFWKSNRIFCSFQTNEANIGNRWEVSLNFVLKRLRGEFYRIFKGFARIVHEVAFVVRTEFFFSQIFLCVWRIFNYQYFSLAIASEVWIWTKWDKKWRLYSRPDIISCCFLYILISYENVMNERWIFAPYMDQYEFFMTSYIKYIYSKYIYALIYITIYMRAPVSQLP